MLRVLHQDALKKRVREMLTEAEKAGGGIKQKEYDYCEEEFSMQKRYLKLIETDRVTRPSCRSLLNMGFAPAIINLQTMEVYSAWDGSPLTNVVPEWARRLEILLGPDNERMLGQLEMPLEFNPEGTNGSTEE